MTSHIGRRSGLETSRRGGGNESMACSRQPPLYLTSGINKIDDQPPSLGGGGGQESDAQRGPPLGRSYQDKSRGSEEAVTKFSLAIALKGTQVTEESLYPHDRRKTPSCDLTD